MKYFSALTLAALLLFSGTAKANPATDVCVRLVDSQGFTFDGVNLARTFGSLCLYTDGSLKLLSKYYSGPKVGRVEWITLTTQNVPSFSDIFCSWYNPGWVAISPWTEGDNIHLCGNDTCINYDGTYRVYGDGARVGNEGGGVRAGAILQGADGHSYVFAIKTASDRGGGGACGGPFGGPGSVGQFILLQQWPYVQP